MQRLSQFADATAATNSIKDSLVPILSIITTIAGVLFVVFLIIGGIYYITSSGNAQKLQQAKDILLRGTTGFVIILAASSITLTMQSAYSQKPNQPQEVSKFEPGTQSPNGADVGTEIMKKFIENIVNDIGKPVTEAISKFLTETPLMAQTPKVFNLWLIVLAICNVLFVVVVALVGFRIMSGTVLGFDEGEIRQILPQIAATFIAMNLSIFFIDFLITIANGMAKALMIGSDNQVFVTALKTLVAGVAGLPIGGMILILILVIVAVMLAVYYLMRLVTLYVGAALSPLIVLLWLIPSFKDFATLAARQYAVTIFILFVHMVILILATSLIDGLGGSNPFISVLIGITTLLILIKTNSIASSTMSAAGVMRGTRRLGSTFASSSRNFTANAKERMADNGGGAVKENGGANAARGSVGTTIASSTGSKFKNFSNNGGTGSKLEASPAITNKQKPQVTVTRVPESVVSTIRGADSTKFASNSKAVKAEE